MTFYYFFLHHPHPTLLAFLCRPPYKFLVWEIAISPSLVLSSPSCRRSFSPLCLLARNETFLAACCSGDASRSCRVPISFRRRPCASFPPYPYFPSLEAFHFVPSSDGAPPCLGLVCPLWLVMTALSAFQIVYFRPALLGARRSLTSPFAYGICPFPGNESYFLRAGANALTKRLHPLRS